MERGAANVGLIAPGTPTQLVAGLKPPMLRRVFDGPQPTLKALARAAVEGGQKGITRCPRPAA